MKNYKELTINQSLKQMKPINIRMMHHDSISNYNKQIIKNFKIKDYKIKFKHQKKKFNFINHKVAIYKVICDIWKKLNIIICNYNPK